MNCVDMGLRPICKTLNGVNTEKCIVGSIKKHLIFGVSRCLYRVAFQLQHRLSSTQYHTAVSVSVRGDSLRERPLLFPSVKKKTE